MAQPALMWINFINFNYSFLFILCGLQALAQAERVEPSPTACAGLGLLLCRQIPSIIFAHL